MSGFLVTQSFLNSRSVLEYAGKRALRIFPALLVVVLLSMLVIGPVFTNLDLHSYFSNNEFYSYFLNAGFIVRYPLPGVFSDHVHPIVNGSLWTLRYEAACYVLLAVIGLMGLLDRKWLMLSVAAGILVATGLGVGSPREILSMLVEAFAWSARHCRDRSHPSAVILLRCGFSRLRMAVSDPVRLASWLRGRGRLRDGLHRGIA
jgi:peptidoglycan/LPS O-acetylase OafA/YrhL